MAIDQDQLKVLRSWVGSNVLESDLNEAYDRLENFDSVVLETLRTRKAVLINDEPGVIVVDGITINQTENIRQLEKLISSFVEAGGTGLETDADSQEAIGGTSVSQMVRNDRAR